MLESVAKIVRSLGARRETAAGSYAELVERLARSAKAPPVDEVAQLLNAAGKTETDLARDVDTECQRIQWRDQVARGQEAEATVRELDRQLLALKENYKQDANELLREYRTAVETVELEIHQQSQAINNGHNARVKLIDNPSPTHVPKLKLVRARVAQKLAEFRAAERRVLGIKETGYGSPRLRQQLADAEAEFARLERELKALQAEAQQAEAETMA